MIRTDFPSDEWAALPPDEQQLERRHTSNGTESVEATAAEERPRLREAKTFPKPVGRFEKPGLTGFSETKATAGSESNSVASRLASFVHLNRKEMKDQIETQKQKRKPVEPSAEVSDETVSMAKDLKTARDGIPRLSKAGMGQVQDSIAHQTLDRDAPALIYDAQTDELKREPRRKFDDIASRPASRSYSYGSMADLDAAERAVLADEKDQTGAKQSGSKASQIQDMKMPHDVEPIFDPMGESDIPILSALVFVAVLLVAWFVVALGGKLAGSRDG